MRNFIIVLIILSTLAFAQNEFLDEEWRIHNDKGIQDIAVFDLDNNKVEEIYATTIGTTKSYIFIYNILGVELDSITLPTPLDAQYATGKERIKAALVTDIEEDYTLDIFTATEIKGGAINTHIFYRLKYAEEEGLNRMYARMDWFDDSSGYINNIQLEKLNNSKLIFLSSMDSKVVVFNPEGEKIKTDNLTTSAWDSAIINETDPTNDYIAGMSRNLCRVSNGNQTWCVPDETRFRQVEVTDINGDGVKEVVAASEKQIGLYMINGTLLWNHSLNYVTDIAVADLTQAGLQNIIVSHDTFIKAYNLEGELQWTYDVGEKIYSLLSVKLARYDDNKLFVGTNENLILLSLDEDYAIKNKAEKLLKLAQINFNQQNYLDSLNLSQQAQRLFEDLGERNNIRTAGNIASKSLDIIEAFDLYQKAQTECQEMRYTQCVNLSEQSIIHFDKYGIIDYRDYARDLITSSYSRKSADESYDSASKLYVSGDYPQALILAKKANLLYTDLDITLGARKSQSLIEMINTQMVESVTTSTLLLEQSTTTIPQTNLSKDNVVFYLAAGVSGLLILSVIFKIIRKKN